MKHYGNDNQESHRQTVKRQLDGARYSICCTTKRELREGRDVYCRLTTAIRFSQFILFWFTVVLFTFGIIFCTEQDANSSSFYGSDGERVGRGWPNQWSGILFLITGSLDLLSFVGLCCPNRHCLIGVTVLQGMVVMMILVTGGFPMDVSLDFCLGFGVALTLIIWCASSSVMLENNSFTIDS